MDLTAAASSFYNILKTINSAATETVGLDCLWCRCVPPEKADDVVINEWSLLNVQCPKKIRVVTSKTDYNPGNFLVDLYQVSYESPLEINIDLDTWNNTFGADTMPQKDDIVYIQILNKIYEVVSSNPVFGVAEMVNSYKCQLAKYSPSAHRKESEDLKESIDALTVSQEKLFGDNISDEVTDIVDPIEFDYNHTTMNNPELPMPVDPYKTQYIDYIIEKTLKLDGNIFANAYYNFKETKEPLIYNRTANYNISSNDNIWIYSAWVQFQSFVDKDIKLRILSKNPKNWKFQVSIIDYKLNIGDKLNIYRGSLLSLNGKIIEHTKGSYILEIPLNEVMKANKKLTGWESTIGWKIRFKNSFNLLTGLDEDSNNIFTLNIEGNSIIVNFNGSVSKVEYDGNIEMSKWHYINISMSSTEDSFYMIERTKNGKSKIVLNKIIKNNKSNLNIDKFEISNINLDFNMCNIRLYENQYSLSENEYLLDAQSKYSRNASKLIIVDDPNIPNKMPYVGQAK